MTAPSSPSPRAGFARRAAAWVCLLMGCALWQAGIVVARGFAALPVGHNPWLSPAWPPPAIFLWLPLAIGAISAAALLGLAWQFFEQQRPRHWKVIGSVLLVIPTVLQFYFGSYQLRAWRMAHREQHSQREQSRLFATTQMVHPRCRPEVLIVDDGRRAYSYLTELRQWDLQAGEFIDETELWTKREPVAEHIESLAASEDGSRFAALTFDSQSRRLQLLDANGRITKTVLVEPITAPRSTFVLTALPQRGTRAVTRCWIDGGLKPGELTHAQITLWDLQSGEPSARRDVAQSHLVALSPNGNWLAIMSESQPPSPEVDPFGDPAGSPVVDPFGDPAPANPAKPAPPPAPVVDPFGARPVYPPMGGLVIYNTATGKVTHQLRREKHPQAIAIDNAGNRLAFAEGQRVEIVQLTGGTRDDPFNNAVGKRGYVQPATAVALQFDAEGQHLAGFFRDHGGTDGHFRIWIVEDGIALVSRDAEVRTTLHDDQAAITPDLRLFVFSSRDALCRYSFATGKELLLGERAPPARGLSASDR